MASGTGGGTMIEAASAGVEGLADAVTSGLDRAGPAGAVARPVVNALRNVWEGYFGAPVPPGGTNWNAYSHQQLYQMLWDKADVGDVSTVAAEWQRHGSEMSSHAETLRGQQGSLRENWSGEAADHASGRLGQLGERADGAGTRAGTVGQATQQAGDSLAVARNTMPKPPGDPTGQAVAAAAAGGAAGAVIGGVLGAGAGGIGAGPGALMGAAIGAVAGGGASLFLSSVQASEKKAEAVHVMQRYETGLNSSSRAIAPGGGTTVDSYGADNSTSASSYLGSTAGSTTGGMPWPQSAATSLDPNLTAGLRSGLEMESTMLARNAAMAELAAARAASGSGMLPPGGRQSGSEEEEQEHQNKMPVLDQALLAPEELTSSPVIGL